MGELLATRDLRVAFPRRGTGTDVEILKGLDLDLAVGESLALTGPSGAGKSLTARALLGLLPKTAFWSGTITWKGVDLTDTAGSAWHKVRGGGMTLILQEPMAALDPVMTVGEQIAETVRHHQGLAPGPAREKAVALLDEMMVPDPWRVASLHPHRLSGGQRQRVLIAAALACDPDLLIADEPTTALDVLVQKGILAALDRVRRQREMALLFISHDRDLVSLLADRVVELRDGRAGRPPVSPGGDVLPAPPSTPKGTPVLEAENLVVRYGRGPAVVAGVDLILESGEALGVAGSSGCGKTSLARALSGHLVPASGSVRLNGCETVGRRAGGRAVSRDQRRRIQLLFQDPGSSLNPRLRVGEAVAEAMGGHREGVPGLFSEVGLLPACASAYRHELSGGQRQRVALARCLAADPTVLIADEPTSALDHRTREHVLALLAQVRAARGLALLMISHDLPVLEQSCGRIAVMLAGVVVEVYSVEMAKPRHPYSRELWAASPATLQGQQAVWEGAEHQGAPLRDADAGGCPHASGCPLWKPKCDKELPAMADIGDGHYVRCPEVEDGPPSQFIDT